MLRIDVAAVNAIAWCRRLAQFTEEPGYTTRTFLSAPMHDVHSELRDWALRLGMHVRIDAAGNFRARSGDGPVLYIGSHLDTVRRAGAFDGILGVVAGLMLVELSGPRRFAIEVVGFSEEEGVRFGVPFIGSRAFIGDSEGLLDVVDADGVSVRDAIRGFGLDAAHLDDAVAESNAIGYFELHIEQGAVLDSLDLQLGVVDPIAGQSRLQFIFSGEANHAGTTPMYLRKDALAGAAEWIVAVESAAIAETELVATVGQISVEPGAGNVIAGRAAVSLDVRHAYDAIRLRAVSALLENASLIAKRRGLSLQVEQKSNQASVPMDAGLSALLRAATVSAHRMSSGAGHDAMIVARRMPTAMLFLRSPGGLSHHPDESVREQDVAAALEASLKFLELLEISHA